MVASARSNFWQARIFGAGRSLRSEDVPGQKTGFAAQSLKGCRRPPSIPPQVRSATRVGNLRPDSAADLCPFLRSAARRKRIRVLLVDDHAVLRQNLATLLGKYRRIEVVGQASDGEKAVELALQLRPDVVLMDVAMPGVDGVEATRRILQSRPATRIIGLSTDDDTETVLAMYKAGAVTYLLKGTDADSLVGAILQASGPA